MILRIKVENYPNLVPPEQPKDDEPPARTVTFCIDPGAIKCRANIESLYADFIQAVRTAIMGTVPPPPRIVVPERLN